MNETQDSYLTIKESAERLNLKQSRIRTAIRKKEVAYHKFGKLIRIKFSDLAAWSEKSSHQRTFQQTIADGSEDKNRVEIKNSIQKNSRRTNLNSEKGTIQNEK